MAVAITIISILAITIIALLANRILPPRFYSGRAFRICPICAGVSGTWLWMLFGMFSGQLPTTGYQLLTAVLMGGSVVGIAYQGEKRLRADSAGWRTPLLWKAFFIPAGFAATYGILAEQWSAFFPALVFLALWSFLFLSPRKRKEPPNEAAAARPFSEKGLGEPRPMGQEELKKKMEDCC